MPTYYCPRCREAGESDLRPSRCGWCGSLGPLRLAACDAAVAAGEDVPAVAGARELSDAAYVEYDRLPSGWDALDAALGGGWARGVVYLLAGAKGGGKSTVLLQTMQNIGGGHRALYLSSEQRRHDLRRIAERARVTRRGILAESVETLEDVLRMLGAEARAGLAFAAVDSIAALRLGSRPEDRPPGYDDAAYIAWRLRHWADVHPRTVLALVNHQNKKGEGTGQENVPHEVGTELFLDNHGGSVRCLRVGKNRAGPGFTGRAWFDMGESGFLVPRDGPPAPPVPDQRPDPEPPRLPPMPAGPRLRVVRPGDPPAGA